MLSRITISLSFILLSISPLHAQNPTDYYYQIPDAPQEFTAANVAARMVDGLGYRYYWATADLRQEDLAYRPSKEARNSRETLEHILGLTSVIVNSTNQITNEGGADYSDLNYEDLRKKTLDNLQEASRLLKNSTDADLENYNIVFAKGDGGTSEFPFWNQLNGPIADALWHVGQIITFRRTSGNPYNSKASMLTGKIRE